MRKSKFKIFFLCELPLILGVAPKRKEQAEDICKETPDIEFEQDWSFTLDATLGDREKIKKYYSSYKDFSCENPIVPYCRGSNVLKIQKIL